MFDQLAELPELHTLELWNATPDVIVALGKAESFPSLGQLRITKSARDSGETRIGASLATAQMPRLASLELGHPIGNDGMKLLADSGLLDRVKELALFDAGLGDKGLAVIASSTVAHQLRSLSLNTPFGKAGLANLGSPGAFPNLRTLNLYASGKQKVHESDLVSFLRSFAIPGIRHLNLEGWPVGDAGAKAIARNPAFANLRWVRMGGCRIGKAGFRALVESPNLSSVVYLYIRANPCERSADLLCDLSLLPNLAECWVLPSDGKHGVRLRKKRPRVAWY